MIFRKKQQQLNIRSQKRRWAFFLTVIIAFAAFAVPAHVHADEDLIGIAYNDKYWDGEKIVTSKNNTMSRLITNKTTTLKDGWYTFASKYMYIDRRLEVYGTVNIFVYDYCDIDIKGGLHLNEGAVLNIYGGDLNNGKLNAINSADYNAAIGGNRNENGRTINVYGGTITAVAGKNAAAIGGGYGGRGPEFTMYGGNVVAEAKSGGAAIGSGASPSVLNVVTGGSASYTQYGGSVRALNTKLGAGVGGGQYSSGIPVRILGGEIDAEGKSGPFGHGDGGSGDYTLEIYDTARVSTGSGGKWVPAGSRENRIKTAYAAYIGPCNHKNSDNTATYTISKSGHVIHCHYCYAEKQGELLHEYAGDQCKVCAYHAGNLCTIHFDKNNKNVSGGMADLLVENGAEIKMIDQGFNAPDNLAMQFWQVGNDSDNHVAPGEKYKVTEDVTLKAVWNNGLISERQLQKAVASGGVVKLDGDICLNSPLVIRAGKSVVLDLNGCKLKRDLRTESPNGHVIEVAKTGSLTIMNSDNNPLNAEITGGAGVHGGGIRNSGTVIINTRVNITGNRTDRKIGMGGGVYNTGTLIIEGGMLTGNTAHAGGGIYNNGTIYMHGGKIKENEADSAGGLWQSGTLALSGNAYIDDNVYGGNIYIDADKAAKEVTVDGETGIDFRVSVINPEAFSTKGYRSTNGEKDPLPLFVDDSGKAKAGLPEESDEIEWTMDNAFYYVEKTVSEGNVLKNEIKGVQGQPGQDFMILESSDSDKDIALSKWNVVRENAEISAGLSCNRIEANIIICDGATLTVNGGISAGSSCTLNIYGQTLGTGKLITRTNIEGKAGLDSGRIIIHGLNVEAKAGKYAAGIGSGDMKGKTASGEEDLIRFLGSTVTAEGGEYAAGIGGGRNGNGRIIEIYDSVITSSGGSWGAGIGSGDEAKQDTRAITIYSGTIYAKGGKDAAGIGGGNACGAGNITINGGLIKSSGGQYGAGIGSGDEPSNKTNNIFIHGGIINSTGGKEAAGIGGGNEGSGGNIYIDGGSIEAGCAGNSGSCIGGGDRRGGGNITIAGGSINVYTDNNGAGIGGGNASGSGKITISGGDVTVRSKGYSPCIGSGNSGAVNTIIISGGLVQARTDLVNDDTYRYPGIGGSGTTYTGSIVISGGVVVAEGGNSSAGIGCYPNSFLGEIRITGGSVTALGGKGGAGIGSGHSSYVKKLTISGGKVIATAGNDYKNAISVNKNEDSEYTTFVYDYDKSMVIAGDSAEAASVVSEAQRKESCRKKYVEISLCNHELSRPASQGPDGHKIACVFCGGTGGKVEPHTFDTNLKCAVCGYETELCTVTFKPGAEDASGTMEQITLPKGEEFELPECDYVYAEHTFSGWETGTQTYQASQSFVLTEDVTLTAAWTQNPWQDLQGKINSAEDGTQTYIFRSGTIAAHTNSQSLVIPSGKEIMLSLESCTVDAGEMTDDQPVFIVRGKLILSGTGTIKGGRNSGISVERGGTLELKGPAISENSGVNGGGVCLEEGASFIMNSGSIRGNSATGRGGGVYAGGSDFIMNGGSVRGNTAGSDGGGVYVQRGSFSMSDAGIERNKTDGNGGGLFVRGLGSGEKTITGCVIDSNTAKVDGGGIYVGNAAISGFKVAECDISSNSAVKGGGIYNDGKADLEGSLIYENSASDSGGGVYSTNELNLADTGVQHNEAASTEDPDNTAAAGGITSSGSISASGDVHITDNKLNGRISNIYLQWGKTIEIADELSKQAQIGITVYRSPEVIANGDPVIITSGLNGKDIFNAKGSKDNFMSDDAQHPIGLSEDGEAQVMGSTLFRVHFDANGGTGSMDDDWANDDEAYILPECEFDAPQRKTFEGWIVGDAGEALAEGEPVQLTGETVVKAKWSDIHDVTIVPSGRMHAAEDGGALQQTGLASAMETVTLGTDDSYYFPKDYASLGTVNGITVEWVSYETITVSGTPTADVELKLAAASERPRAEMPQAEFTATGPDTGVLSNVGPDIAYRFADGEFVRAAGTSVNLENLAAGTLIVYRVSDLEYGLDSSKQHIEVIKPEKPELEVTQPEAGTKGSIATTDDHEYTTDAEHWTRCSGALTGLDTGTYAVRVRAEANRLASEPQTILIRMHEHDWTYELSGNGTEVTARCGAPDCALKEGLKLEISAPDADACSYDGQPKAAALGGGYNASAFPDVSEIEYFRGDSALESAPVDAGSYRAQVTAGTGDKAVTAHVDYDVRKADAVVDPPAGRDLIYDETEQELVSAGSAEGGELQYALGNDNQTAPEDGWSTTIPKGTEIGFYYVWYRVKGDGNHNDAGPELCMTSIARAAPDDFSDEHRPTAIQDLVYNGKEQQLVAEPVESYPDCAVNYSIDGGRTWVMDENNDPALPVAVDAGKYVVTVYYAMPYGTRDFIETIEVTIMPRQVTITPDETSKFFGEEDPELQYMTAGLPDGVEFSGALAREEGEDTGTYEFVMGTLTLGAAESNCDVTLDSSRKFTIKPREVTSPIILLDRLEFPYTGRGISPEITVYDGTTVIPQEEYGLYLTGDNVNAGLSRIGIKDLPGGNYSFEGRPNAVFAIVRAEQFITAEDVTATVGETGRTINAATTGTDEDITLRFAVIEGDEIVSVDAESGGLTLRSAGTATVRITASETANYLGATEQVTVTVSEKDNPDVDPPEQQDEDNPVVDPAKQQDEDKPVVDPAKQQDEDKPAADPAGQMGEDKTAYGKGASFEAVTKAITSLKSDSDPKGTVFRILRFRASGATKTGIRLKWTKVRGAKRYVLYANKCGKKNKYKKLKVLTKNSLTVKKVAGRKLRKGTYYKFILVALDKNNRVISTSKVVHAVTAGKKYANYNKVTTREKKNKVTVKIRKKFRLKAKAVKAGNKKASVHRVVRYETTNKKVATVSRKGVIRGIRKGTCYIYAYAQNGVFRKIKVTVK